MDYTIKIPKRLYDDLKQYCSATNTDIDKYCSLVLRKQLTLEKYGDLNEKIQKKEVKITPVEEPKPKVEEIKPKEIVKPEPFAVEETKIELPTEIDTDEVKPKHRTIKVK